MHFFMVISLGEKTKKARCWFSAGPGGGQHRAPPLENVKPRVSLHGPPAQAVASGPRSLGGLPDWQRWPWVNDTPGP